MATAHSCIDSLGLEPHPEGGHYRRIHTSSIEIEANGRRRPAMTAIRYLLDAGECSSWHRVDADESWHWDQGGCLELLMHREGSGRIDVAVLGPGGRGHPCCVVPAGVWQAARTPDRHAVVTCVVAPGFVWEGFELLAPDSALARELRGLPVVKR